MAKNRTSIVTTIIVAVVASALTMAGADHFKLTQQNANDKEKIKAIVKEYLNEEPKAIIEALQGWKLREEARLVKKQQEAVEKHAPELMKADHMPYAGNPDGDVTIVEFYDYNCPACKAMFESLNVLLKEDDNVRVIFAEFPIFGPTSIKNAKLALAVNKVYQDKFLAFHEALMRNKGKTDEAYALQVIKNLGMDVEKVKEAAADPALDEELQEVRTMAKEMEIRGTPAAIVGNTLFNGVVGYKDLKDHIAFIRHQASKEEGDDDDADEEEKEEEGEE